jgi:hypothetical protein
MNTQTCYFLPPTPTSTHTQILVQEEGDPLSLVFCFTFRKESTLKVSAENNIDSQLDATITVY